MTDTATRRPSRSRSSPLARRAATYLLGIGLRPNQVSMLGVIFAALAAAQWLALAGATPLLRSLLGAGAALAVGLRLACGLLDGLMAIEGGARDRAGDFYNELPERLSDVILFVTAGWVARDYPGGWVLGWVVALAAVFTAYVRLLGVTTGQRPDFSGPFAKPQRMAVLAAASLVGAILPGWRPTEGLLWLALVLLASGTAFTALRRTLRLGRALQAED